MACVQEELAGDAIPSADLVTELIDAEGKTVREVAEALSTRIRGAEYVAPAPSGTDAPWPNGARWIACYAVAGANEGHYVHVDAIHTHPYGRAVVQQLLIVKVLTGREHALAIAAVCTRVLQAA